MFTYLNPVVEGFMTGYMSLIGLDGCHINGTYPGICLVEKIDTWIWFIDLLAYALGTMNGEGYTYSCQIRKK